MLKTPRVNVCVKVNFIEQAFQPSTPDEFSTPPHMVLNGKLFVKQTYLDMSC
jgi:hypothetical protein